MLDRSNEASVVGSSDARELPAVAGRANAGFGLDSLRRHAVVVGLSVLLFTGVGLAFVAFRSPTYTASTLLLVYNRQISTGTDAVVLPGSADISLVQNQIEILQSGNVLTKVINGQAQDHESANTELGWSIGAFLEHFWPWAPATLTKSQRRTVLLEQLRRKLKGTRVGASHIVALSFKARNPQYAALTVNEIARTYLQELSRAWDVGTTRSPALRELYRSLGPSAYVVSKAALPVRPDGPAAYAILAGAVVAGALIGAAAALLIDFFDNTFRSADQVESVVGLPCLAVIPRVKAARNRRWKRKPVPIGGAAGGLDWSDVQERSLPQGRALWRLAAAIQDPSLPELKCIGIIAADAGEGATTVAIGLAKVLAAAGKRVLVIDAVPEHPSARGWFASRRNGCGSEIADGVLDVKGRLNVIAVARTSGMDPYSACPEALECCVNEASNQHDVVLIDLPSLASGPSARTIARTVDGFLLVVRWGETDAALIRQAILSAGEAQAKFIGIALNAAEERASR
jgi:polysaccharide biosynthesis transport protein